MMNKGLFGFLMLFLLLSSVAAKQDIEHVKLRHLEAQTFHRISEFFTGIENTGRRVILRTKPEEREGLYFILRLSDKLQAGNEGARFLIDYYQAGRSKRQHCEFVVPVNPKNKKTIYLGITGNVEEDQVLPVAWRIQFVDKAGGIISEKKSFLWEMPDE